MSQKFLIIVLVLFIAITVSVAVIYIVSPDSISLSKKGGGAGTGAGMAPDKPKIVEENLVIPQTQEINGGEGREASEGPVAVPLVPKTEAEKVAVAKAILTVKGGYNLAVIEASGWAKDINLVFIKSSGAITLEGKSSQWQLVFSSKAKPGKGYEIIIQGGQIVSRKEIELSASGAALPGVWKDSGEIMASLQELPQFSNATVSSINLYYNGDGNLWRYVLSTSRGNTSMSAE